MRPIVLLLLALRLVDVSQAIPGGCSGKACLPDKDRDILMPESPTEELPDVVVPSRVSFTEHLLKTEELPETVFRGDNGSEAPADLDTFPRNLHKRSEALCDWFQSLDEEESDLHLGVEEETKPPGSEDTKKPLSEDTKRPVSEDTKPPGTETGLEKSELSVPAEKTVVETLSAEDKLPLVKAVAEKEFSSLLGKMGLEKLHPKAPHLFSISSKGLAGNVGKIAKGSLEVVGVAFWAKGVVDAFSHEATTLQRAAAVTSIIPVVGCIVGAAAEHEAGKVNVLDTALCLGADLLMLTPAWPVGLLLQGVRVLIEVFFHEHSMSPDELEYMAYYSMWNKHKRYMFDRLRSSHFIRACTAEYEAQQVALAHLAAHAAGTIHAANVQNASHMQQVQNELAAQGSNKVEYEGSDLLYDGLCSEISKKRDHFEKELTHQLSQHVVSQYEQFDRDWFRERSDEHNLQIKWPDRFPQQGLEPGPDAMRDIVPLVHDTMNAIKAPQNCPPHKTQRRYISDIKVQYTGRIIPPKDSIQETDWKPADINYNFDGEFVWLVPTYTLDANDACTSFELIITSDEDESMQDLAKGAGGKFRYLKCIKDGSSKKVHEAKLLRGVEHYADNMNWGIDFKTGDINKHRDGECLFLQWTTVQV